MARIHVGVHSVFQVQVSVLPDWLTWLTLLQLEVVRTSGTVLYEPLHTIKSSINSKCDPKFLMIGCSITC